MVKSNFQKRQYQLLLPFFYGVGSFGVKSLDITLDNLANRS